jgi:hypothetical protein
MFAAAEWQAAMEALILVATSGGPTMFAAHRRHASVEPPRRARVQCRSEGSPPGPPEAGEGSLDLLYNQDLPLAVGSEQDQ